VHKPLWVCRPYDRMKEKIINFTWSLGVGKVSGAGGGGFMFLFCPFDRKPLVAKRLTELGGDVLTVAFGSRGMESWGWAGGNSARAQPSQS
jgi:galactokinase/mevalonate kinase-like predicted kinase